MLGEKAIFPAMQACSYFACIWIIYRCVPYYAHVIFRLGSASAPVNCLEWTLEWMLSPLCFESQPLKAELWSQFYFIEDQKSWKSWFSKDQGLGWPTQVVATVMSWTIYHAPSSFQFCVQLLPCVSWCLLCFSLNELSQQLYFCLENCLKREDTARIGQMPWEMTKGLKNATP